MTGFARASITAATRRVASTDRIAAVLAVMVAATVPMGFGTAAVTTAYGGVYVPATAAAGIGAVYTAVGLCGIDRLADRDGTR